jgi:hypothetical protein
MFNFALEQYSSLKNLPKGQKGINLVAVLDAYIGTLGLHLIACELAVVKRWKYNI